MARYKPANIFKEAKRFNQIQIKSSLIYKCLIYVEWVDGWPIFRGYKFIDCDDLTKLNAMLNCSGIVSGIQFALSEDGKTQKLIYRHEWRKGAVMCSSMLYHDKWDVPKKTTPIELEYFENYQYGFSACSSAFLLKEPNVDLRNVVSENLDHYINEPIPDYWEILLRIKMGTSMKKAGIKINHNTAEIFYENLSSLFFKDKKEKTIEDFIVDLSDLVAWENERIGITHFIDRKTYEAGPRIKIISRAREKLGLYFANRPEGKWAEYFMVNGYFMTVNGGLIKHLRAAYELSDEEIYSSLLNVANDKFYYLKNHEQIIEPSNRNGYCYYPNGFYGSIGGMRNYLSRRGMSHEEIDEAQFNIKNLPNFYQQEREKYIKRAITSFNFGELLPFAGI